MTKRTIGVIISTALVFALVGFAAGRTVQADTAQPGSTADPLVTKSYVTQQVNETNQDVAKLTQKITTLESKVANLEAKVASLTKTPTPVILTVTATTVNVRSGPGTNYTKIATLSKGTKVTYIKTQGDWKNIKMSSGKTGWVHKNYVK